MTCYICLEETEEKSPCACGTPCHLACLQESLTKQHSRHCTICKTDIDLPEVRVVVGVDDVVEPPPRPRPNAMCRIMYMFFTVFVLTIFYDTWHEGLPWDSSHTYLLSVFVFWSMWAWCRPRT